MNTEIIQAIAEKMDDLELTEVEAALQKGWKRLFPDWEIIRISLPKNDPKERRRIQKWICEMILREQEEER